MVSKQTIVVIGSALVAIGGLTWYAYDQGKKKHQRQPLPFDIIDEHGEITDQAQHLEVLQQIAGAMYDDMKGFNIFSIHNPTPYEQALALSNTNFVELYNIFNSRYQGENGETLTQWIMAEGTDPIGGVWTVITNAMLNRLNSLNLP